jgi:prepilin-type N-terminal cleavage/methylation domain-containing protein
MPRPRSTAGFTLIELLIVVVIIGILAVVAVPKFSTVKGKSYVASLRADLRNLATAEETYFYANDTYTANLDHLKFTPSPNVTITFGGDLSSAGWAAEATHPLAPVTSCALFVGKVTPVGPATGEGVIVCE